MRASLLPLLLLLAVGSGTASAASPDAAGACAATLKPGAKSVYDAALPSIKPGANLRAVLKHVVLPEVKSGEITRGTARHRAEEAGRCLQLMQ